MTDDYLKRAGLTEEQIRVVRDGLKRESRYRVLMLRNKVDYRVACHEADYIDPDIIDLSDEELLTEKIKTEFKTMIF